MAATDLFQLSQIAEQVALNYGAVDDLTLAKSKKWINRALLMFSELGYWSWQRVYGQTLLTVASQTEYAVGAIKITSLYMASPIQRDLILIEDRRYRQLYPNDQFFGAPYFWRRMGQSKVAVDTQFIGLYPIPDAIYTLKFDGIREMTLLSADTDDVRAVTGMPSKCVNMLIELATSIGFKELDDAQYREQFEECLVRLKGLYGDDQTEIEDVLVFATLDNNDINYFQDPILPPNYG